jgi:hypothetical protein
MHYAVTILVWAIVSNSGFRLLALETNYNTINSPQKKASNNAENPGCDITH